MQRPSNAAVAADPSTRSGPVVTSAALGAGFFVLYAAGACPSIYVGDSGELVAAVHTLGIPHPSGYPLYVLLGKLWTLALPVGSVAYRMSLFSAACGALTVALVHSACRRLDLHPVAAATSAMLLGVSASFWAQANTQRVYSLNALFLILVVSAALSWHRSRRSQTLFAAFLLCGLGASNHPFMVFAAVAVAVFVVSREPRLLRAPRLILGALACFVAGLLPYLYLPLRSRANPRLDWGDPESLASFLAVVTRREYWSRAWLEGPSDLLAILADYSSSFGSELLWVGTGLAVVGAILSRRAGPLLPLSLLVMSANLFAVALHGSRSDIFIWHRYYIPSYVMAALLAGVGTHWLIGRIPQRFRFLPLLIPIVGLLLGYREFDRSRYRIAESFSRQLLASLPPGAHLSASDDNILFVLVYLQLVEGLRPDVNLILEGVGGDAPPLRFNPAEESLLFTHHPNWSYPDLEIVPVGLAFQVVRSGQPPMRFVIPERLEGETDPRVPKDYLTRNLIGHFHFMVGSSLAGRDWPRALRALGRAATAAPEDDVLHYNLGLFYAKNGLYDEAIAAFDRSRAINPRHLPGAPEALAEQRVLETLLARRRALELEAQLPQTAAEGVALRHFRLAEDLIVRNELEAARGHFIRGALAEEAANLDDAR